MLLPFPVRLPRATMNPPSVALTKGSTSLGLSRLTLSVEPYAVMVLGHSI
jgi:hypothetical protein